MLTDALLALDAAVVPAAQGRTAAERGRLQLGGVPLGRPPARAASSRVAPHLPSPTHSQPAPTADKPAQSAGTDNRQTGTQLCCHCGWLWRERRADLS